MDGERGDVGGTDDAADRERRPQLIAALTHRAALAWDLPYGTLSDGASADLVILDPDQAWLVDTERFFSKGKNSPLGGQTLRGTVLLTMAQGKIAYRNGL